MDMQDDNNRSDQVLFDEQERVSSSDEHWDDQLSTRRDHESDSDLENDVDGKDRESDSEEVDFKQMDGNV